MTITIDPASFGKIMKTTSDATDFQRILEKLTESLYRTDTSVEETLRRSLPYEQAILVNRIAAQHGVSMDDKAGVQEFFIKLLEAIRDLPVIQITLAIKPNESLVTIIHDWFFRTYHKLVILDIIINPKILGGSIISTNGKYFDYSLGKQVQKYFGAVQ